MDEEGCHLGAAELLAAHGDPFNDLVCFHAQQAAEKYVKAFLIRHQVEFRKTHDMNQLLDLVAAIDAELSSSLRDAGALTRFSVEVRYPVSSPAATHEDASAALAVARRVREAVCRKIDVAMGQGGH